MVFATSEFLSIMGPIIYYYVSNSTQGWLYVDVPMHSRQMTQKEQEDPDR